MRLSQKWVAKLFHSPGAGTGCQTIDVVLKNGSTVEHLIVLRCQDILGTVHFFEDEIVEIIVEPDF